MVQNGEMTMNDDLNDFEQFMKQREDAAEAYVGGDAEPLGRITTQALPATFFPPRGGFTERAEDVSARYERDVMLFEPGGESTFEILQMAAGDTIGYWVGFQRATARMKGNPEPIPFDLRVTEVFRRENGRWKMVHRHADPLASESPARKE
jgi:ketosteroid isomerase-like protein